jgi:NADPH:quinone reductase-like Zn-dependent oxidoreductase
VNAAVVNSFENPPHFGAFEDPVAETNEQLVSVRAAALSTLVKAQASGRHYSSKAVFPFVPGVDGIGRLAGGRRVYFAFPRAPFGAMAQVAPVQAKRCVPVPDEVDDATAAAIANPGMSSWAALVDRAKFSAGESVLINGATGVAGRLAVQIAKHLGARTVIATGRNQAALDLLPALGADVVIPLASGDQNLAETSRREIRAHAVGVIVDYLWGASAEALIAAIAGDGSNSNVPPIRFVQVGASSGPSLTLNAGALRSSDVQLLGSGIGSVSLDRLVAIVGQLLEAVVPAKLAVATAVRPIESVETAWNEDVGARRLVFTFAAA